MKDLQPLSILATIYNDVIVSSRFFLSMVASTADAKPETYPVYPYPSIHNPGDKERFRVKKLSNLKIPNLLERHMDKCRSSLTHQAGRVI